MESTEVTDIMVKCYHCGLDCKDEVVTSNGKNFCCVGCQMVNELLRGEGLDPEKLISISQKETANNRNYNWLNDPVIVDKLIDFQEGSKIRISFYLPQIYCSECIRLLEKLYKIKAGILHSLVNFPKKEISIFFDKDIISLKEVVALLTNLGYPPKFNLSDLEKKPKTNISKRLIFQIGIAGFAFGNAMLLSFPEYFGLNSFREAYFHKLFGYLNFLLAIPVLLYAAQDYLKSAWIALRERSLNIDIPISLGIFTLFSRSSYEIITQTGAGYFDSFTGLIFFLLIGKWFQQRTYYHLSFEHDFKSYFPIAALLADGKSVPVNQLKIGDQIVIKNQEIIPADGLLLDGDALLDYSFVTGESMPLEKSAGHKLFAGGRLKGNKILLQITKTVDQSYLTQLWNESAFKNAPDNEQLTITNRTGKYFTIIVLLIAFTTLFYWLPKDLALAINAFTSVLIIACPCAIALSVPFTYGNAVRLLGKMGFYLKNLTVLEKLISISTVVFDKTGTLTHGGESYDIQYLGAELSLEEKAMFKALAQQSAHPLSQLIDKYFDKIIPTEEVKNYKEITGEGTQAIINQHFIKIGSASFVNHTKEEEQGVFLLTDDKIKGRFIIKNKYRKGLKGLIEKLKTQFELHLISGDNDSEKQFLQQYFPANALHFQQKPKDKLYFIKTLQEKNEKVLMIGDGLNDAGALKQSDVGIVLSENTNNFSPACDAIMDAGMLEKLPKIINYAKWNLRIIYGAYTLAAIYNIIGLSYAVRGVLSPVIAAILMPLSSISIVTIGVTGSWLAAKKIFPNGSQKRLEK